MFCPNCGTQNAEDVKFCANCGAALQPASPAPAVSPAPSQAPVQPMNAQAVNPVYGAIQSAPQKTNGLCIAGFITSMVSILTGGLTALISLILSIIGVVSAGKKNQKGKGLGIAGTIISAVLIVCLIGVILFNASNYYGRSRRARSTTEYDETTYSRRTERETTEETTEETTAETTEETTRETTEETTASESKSGAYLDSVGNDKTGKVKLTEGKWISFHEAGGFSKDIVEHEQAADFKGSIIGLFVVNVNYTPEEMAKSQMYSMEQAGAKKVTGAHVKISGYDAIQCYGTYPDGMILVCWFFKGNDGLLRKITVEFKPENSSVFSMVEKNYKLD